MPTELTPFIFEGHEVRTLTREGDPWFVLADVCAVLAHSNPSQAAAVLDEDEKHTLSNAEGIAAAQVQSLTIISEPGLYKLMMRSRKPAAKRFDRWVRHEVLPAIRKTGRYVAPAAPLEEVETPDDLKLRKVNTAVRCFGERAGAQLWAKLGLDWVPAMAPALSQTDLLDSPHPPGSVTITVTPNRKDAA